jgi:putative transposase
MLIILFQQDHPVGAQKVGANVNHYNEVHPHKALGYRSPREFIAAHGSP